MNKQINATAQVQITVEINAGCWGQDCSVEQVFKQAADSAQSTLINALKAGLHGVVRVVGAPKVIGIFTEKNA